MEHSREILDLEANMKNTLRMCECTQGGEGSLTSAGLCGEVEIVFGCFVSSFHLFLPRQNRRVKGVTLLFKVEKLEHSSCFHGASSNRCCLCVCVCVERYVS